MASLRSLFSLVAAALATEEQVTVSDFFVHKQASTIGNSINSVSFRLKGAIQELQCSAGEIAYPEPVKLLSCSDSKYAFTLWPGTSHDDFRVIIHHDVGDRYVIKKTLMVHCLTRLRCSKANLRGAANVATVCDENDVDNASDVICRQINPVSFSIDGPIAWTFAEKAFASFNRWTSRPEI